MSAETHRKKLHDIVDISTSQVLFERLETLLSAAMHLDDGSDDGQPFLVKETEALYRTPLKQRLHKMIDAVLSAADIAFIKNNIEPEFEGKDFWEGLSIKERLRIEKSMEEAKDPANLVSHEQVMEMAKGWIRHQK